MDLQGQGSAQSEGYNSKWLYCVYREFLIMILLCVYTHDKGEDLIDSKNFIYSTRETAMGGLVRGKKYPASTFFRFRAIMSAFNYAVIRLLIFIFVCAAD